jgi:hypothetical protein
MTWTQATANAGWSARYGHTSVVFDNKMWVMGGYDGSYRNDVWYSSDGVTWIHALTNAQWSGRAIQASDVFDNKMWIIGGLTTIYPYSYRDVWYSTGLNGIEDNTQVLVDRILSDVYPNPASSEIRVHCPSSAAKANIYNVTGKVIKEVDIYNEYTNISLKGINPGIYFLQIGNEAVTKKLVITK